MEVTTVWCFSCTVENLTKVVLGVGERNLNIHQSVLPYFMVKGVERWSMWGILESTIDVYFVREIKYMVVI